MDDQQIGGGSGATMGPSSAESADNTGPLEKRIVSKNWSVRANAYEELTKLSMNSEKKSKADHFKDHIGGWKEYLKDSNPGALEKALVCLNAFLDKIHPTLIGENQNIILNLIVEKCIGHAKPVIKDKGLECMLLMFEVSENFEDSVETLQQLCAHKNIKVMTCGTIAVAMLLENFGVKKIRIPDYAEQMLKNAQNTNPACKTAAYDYYKAAYKWIGDAILPQIDDKLKKLQLDELKKMFEEVKAKNDKTMRYVRSEKAKAEEAKLNAQIEASMAEEVKEVDPLEFAPEKDVLKDFGAEWMETAEGIKKWDEKVAKISELTKACNNVKIKPGNTEAVSGFLKKEIGNSNINISLSAMEAATALANGMGKNFQTAGKQLCTPIFLKFKEKKTNVIDAAAKYGDALLKVCTLEELREEVIPLITNVAPGVKTGVLKFVEKAAVVTYIDVLKRVIDELLTAVKKVTEDKDGGVRDQALHCMGILKGRTPDEAEKHLKDVNPQKMAKIDEAAKEIKPSKYDRPENWKPPKPKAAAKKQDDDGDELMSFDSKPKKAPPKNIGQKPPSKKKTVESEDAPMEEEEKKVSTPAPKRAAAKEASKDDEMMSSDAPKAPAKKPPALSSAKPKAAAASSGGAKPSAPVVQEEDVGAGCSKEEALEKVADFFSASTVAKFEDAKWQAKVEGFTELQNEIKEKEAPADIIEAAAKFIKVQLKDYKESNINLQKSAVGFYAFIAKNCDNVNKRTVHTAMAFFVDKIGDAKLSTAVKEMLMDISEIVTPKFVCLQLIKHASTAKAPKNLQESCALITQMIDEFGIGACSLKETIELGVIAAAHATPAVRQAAMKMFCEMYKHVGEAIKTFLTDIKESTLKVIEAELGKTEQYKKGEHQKKRSFRGEAAEEATAGGKGGKKGAAEDDPLASLPREDISKKLTGKLMEQFKNKDWKIRKKACDDVEALLREAKMRIKDTGLNDLMDALKNGMKDPNKAVVKVNFNLLGLMADALGPEVKQYTKKCLVPMLNNISDKQSLVRQDVVACMNKWKENCGAPTVINQLGPVLEIENPEGRTETLKWISDNKEAIKQSDYKSLIKPLVMCLTDKSKAIRESAEALIELIMPLTGYQAFINETNDMKQAIKQTIRPMLEKLKTRVADAPAPSGTDEKKDRSKSPPSREEASKPSNSFAKAATLQKKAEPEEPAPKKQASSSGTAKPAASSKQEAAEDEVTIKPQNKKKRAENDSKVKWPLYEVKGDHIEKLQAQCYDIFGQKFHDLMWAKAADFPKHIKCVEQFEQFINTQPDELIEVLDIIFKWCNVRLNESSNTKLVVSILDFFGNLITFLHKTATELQEFEVFVLLGTLCDKVGINNKILMDKIRKLIKMCYDVYDIQNCYRIIIEQGVKAKNQKSAAECLDEVAEYIQKNGIDHVTKKDFALFLTMTESADKSLRENSLKVFGQAYEILGEDIWRLLGKDINTKVKGLLEQRFKQVQKKTGNNLAMSTNSFKDQMVGGVKKNNLMLSGSANGIGPQKAVAVEKPNSGLKQSMKSEKSNLSGKDNQDLESQMKKFAPFADNDNLPVGGQKPQVVEDVEMKVEETKKPDLKDVFAGKTQVEQPQEKLIPHFDKEDDVAMTVDVKPNVSALKAESMQKGNLKIKCQDMDEDHHAIQNLLKEAEMNLDIDPAVRQEQKNILNHIQQLVEGDLLKRVDSLVALNEMISSNQGGEGQTPNQALGQAENPVQQQALIRCCNQLINAFTHVMNDIFSYPVNEIPLRFTKYFITIVNKTCACKEIMKEVNEKQVHLLAEQLLTRLLIQNLDKIGQNKEGELILKSLNSAMLRMLENCNHTFIFITLFSLLVQFKNNPNMQKMPDLIIKCLLKLSKIMDKLINGIDLARFLIAIHKYLCSIDHDNKSQQDDLGIRIVKTLVNELVKLKKAQIWESYQKAGIETDKQPDVHIKKWIQIIIRSLPDAEADPANATADSSKQPQSVQNSEQKQAPQSRMYIEFEIKKIIQELRDPSKLEQAIPKLDKFAKQNPTYNFQANLTKESDEFCKQIMTYLENFRNGNSMKSTNEDSLGGSNGLNKSNKMDIFKNKLNAVNQNQLRASNVQSSSDPMTMSFDKHSEFKNKMAELKKKQTNTTENTPVNQTNQQQTSTFSALNTSLSQKWAAINANQRGKQAVGFAGRPQTAQPGGGLAQTINPSMGQNLNESQNKFQSKLQGLQASKLNLNKAPGLQQQPINTVQSGLNSHRESTTQATGGVQMNSFKSRLQGFQGGAQTLQAQSNATTDTSNQSANTQDLSKRLAEMKARLQGINNKK